MLFHSLFFLSNIRILTPHIHIHIHNIQHTTMCRVLNYSYLFICSSMFLSIFTDRTNPPWAFYIVFIGRTNKLFYTANIIYQFLVCYELVLFSCLVEIVFIFLITFSINRFEFIYKILCCLNGTRIMDAADSKYKNGINNDSDANEINIEFLIIKTFITEHNDLLK